MSQTFAIVSCANPELTTSGPAYLMCRTSPGFAGNYELASNSGNPILILIPDYGLVHPQETLSPTDGGLGGDRWSEGQDRWLTRVQRELASLRWLEEDNRWMVYGGGDWADRTAAALTASGQSVQRVGSAA